MTATESPIWLTAKRVVRTYDDRECPTIGYVLGWEDEDRCNVVWGDSAYADDPWSEARIEFADELMPVGRTR